jgi:catechol 2,3-dioxygenase-like lactoylglutathione lyase family enzyme
VRPCTTSRRDDLPGAVGNGAGSWILGLDHVQVTAPPGSERQARQFFGELLDLPEVEKPEALRGRGGVWFACGEQQLHVGATPEFVPAGKAHPALRVGGEDLDALARRLTGAGHPVRWDAALPAVRRFYSADPWGNRIEFIASG